MIELNDDNFDVEVLDADVPVLVDFWADWCSPCKVLAPILDSVAKQYNDKIKVCKLDTDADNELAARYGISSIPTVIVFKDGKEVDKFVGVKNKKYIESVVEKVLT